MSLRRIFDVTRRCALIAVRRRGDAGLKAARAATSSAALGLTASDSLRGFLLELLADTPQLLSMLFTKAASGHRRPGTPITRTTAHTSRKGTRPPSGASRMPGNPPKHAVHTYPVRVSNLTSSGVRATHAGSPGTGSPTQDQVLDQVDLAVIATDADGV